MMRIMIVDDEPNIIELLTRMLDPELAKLVAVAQNGKEAYQRVVELKPDVLITDIRMPGMSGLELIENVKSLEGEPEIIVISGYREFDYLQSVLKFGVQEFLLKPVEYDELNAALKRVRDKRCAAEKLEDHLNRSYECLREEYTLKLLLSGTRWLKDARMPEGLFHFEPGKYSAAVIKVDCETESAENWPYVRSLLDRYRALIVQTFQSACYELVSAVHSNCALFILNYDRSTDESAFWNRQGFNVAYMSDMLVAENYKYRFLHFTMGIGETVYELDELGDSLRSAMHAVGNRLNSANNGVIFGKRDEVESAETHLSTEFKNAIIAGLTALDASIILSAYSREVDSIVQNPSLYWRLPESVYKAIRYMRNTVLYNGILEEAEYPQNIGMDEKIVSG